MSPKKKTKSGGWRPDGARIECGPVLEAGLTGGITLLGAAGGAPKPGKRSAERSRRGDGSRGTIERNSMKEKVADALARVAVFLTEGADGRVDATGASTRPVGANRTEEE